MGRAGPAVPIRAKGADEAAIAHIIPATGTARDFFGGDFGILVISKLPAAAALGIHLLQGLFDLTTSEARLASGIAEGLTLETISTRAQIRVDTVRSLLKAVFRKTGVKR